MFRHFYHVILFAFITLLGCGDASVTSTDPSQVANNQIVGVSGNQMTLNDAPWLSRGIVLQGFVRPLAALQANSDTSQQAKEDLQARMNYGATELAAIKAYDADTIRFQIGQPALDPTSTAYDPAYLNEVIGAVKSARQAGFVVMIMMQDEIPISGETTPHKLPIQETENNWDLFAAAFGSDRGVVFELYNEPNLIASPANWQRWLNGGNVPGQAEQAIGMQKLVNHIRGNGAKNVLVLDGLGITTTDPATGDKKQELAETLQGLPEVADPLNRLVFAVHPYQHGLTDESQWDADFGVPSGSVPVWADEWSAPEGIALGLSSQTNYQVAVDLLNYLRTHSISLCTGAFDVPQFMVQDVPGWTLTSYDPTTQTKSSGRLVLNDFAANYAKQLTLADGL